MLEPSTIQMDVQLASPEEENLFNPFANDLDNSDLCDPILKYRAQCALAATRSLPGRIMPRSSETQLSDDGGMFEPVVDITASPFRGKTYSPEFFYEKVLSRKFIDPEQFTDEHFSDERTVSPPDAQPRQPRFVELEVRQTQNVNLEITSASPEVALQNAENKAVEVGRFVITRRPFIRTCQSDIRCRTTDSKRKPLKRGVVQTVPGRLAK